MRKQFRLPEADEDYLESLGRPWETVAEGNVQWVIAHDWPVPSGYNRGTVLAGVIIPPGYPDGALDMVYFDPHLVRSDGTPIGGLGSHQFDGRNWQRWSRHYTPQNPWRPGVDELSTHYTLVDHWLRRDLPGVRK
jgi:Prokaryotic E2 family E